MVESIAWAETRNELRKFIYRRVKDKAISEDIVQDVFLKVHSKLWQLKDAKKMMGWIYQITRNTIVEHFRSQSKVVFATEPTSEHQPLNDCAAACLVEIMDSLPEKYREVLKLAEIGNMSQIELANKLNISYSGAKSRVQRARQMLKAEIDKHYVIKTDGYGNVIVCKNRLPCNCQMGH